MIFKDHFFTPHFCQLKLMLFDLMRLRYTVPHPQTVDRVHGPPHPRSPPRLPHPPCPPHPQSLPRPTVCRTHHIPNVHHDHHAHHIRCPSRPPRPMSVASTTSDVRCVHRVHYFRHLPSTLTEAQGRVPCESIYLGDFVLF